MIGPKNCCNDEHSKDQQVCSSKAQAKTGYSPDYQHSNAHILHR